MRIGLVGVEAVEGGKGVFDRAGVVTGIAVAELKDVSATVASFCQEFLTGLNAIDSQDSTFGLKTVEVNIELTLKGEVRLIASASTETKGSLKLTFGVSSKE